MESGARGPMIKITFVAPYHELEEEAIHAFQHYPNQNILFKTIDAVGAKVVNGLKFNCDVIIARGVTAFALSKCVHHIPIIELPVTGYDVIRAVHQCKTKFEPKKIALIGSSNMIFGAQSLKGIFDVNLEYFLVEKEEEAEYCVDQAIKSCADVIIGGVMTTRIGEAKNVQTVLIESGAEAIYQALDEAVRTALITKHEKEKTERFKTIMDYTHEGIVAVDKDGLITVFNKSAQKLTNSKQDTVLNKYIKDVLIDTGLPKILNSGKEQLGALQKIDDITVAANRVPIKIGEEIVGAVATFQDITKIQELEEQIRKKIHAKGLTAKYTFKNLIGNSPAIQETIDISKKYSQVDSNILIIGETGTGKELIAQSIHSSSTRKTGPFVAVNCAALPANLLESELFGYVEGAFTGAAKGGKPGLFELAHRGTIFLDEIAEISLKLQARLLRVLQEKEIMRLGDNKVIPINVRVISATNKSLREMVKKGRFRQDLLYRLDILKITVPSLREREEDIILLIRFFLDENNKKFNKDIQGISPEAEQILLEYEWPGNIREVKNICERLSVLIDHKYIEADDVKKVLELEEKSPSILAKKALKGKPSQEIIKNEKSKIEREIIIKALKEANYNKAEASRILGIGRTTLWRRLKELNL